MRYRPPLASPPRTIGATADTASSAASAATLALLVTARRYRSGTCRARGKSSWWVGAVRYAIRGGETQNRHFGHGTVARGGGGWFTYHVTIGADASNRINKKQTVVAAGACRCCGGV